MFVLSLLCVGAGVWNVLIFNSIGMKALGLTAILIGNVIAWIAEVGEE